MFRNVFVFAFPESSVTDAATFASDLAAAPLRDVGPLELSTSGFVLPAGEDGTDLVIESGPYRLFAVGVQEKILPAAVVREELGRRIRALFEKEGRRPGGKERRRMKDEVTSDLMARAFVYTRRTLAYLDMELGYIVIDSSSRTCAEAVVSQVREAVGRFPAVPLMPEESPRALMTQWLIDDRPPEGFAFGEACELRDPSDGGAIVRCRRQDLESDEVREHLKSGKQVFQLALSTDRLSFTLDDALVLRSFSLSDVVMEDRGDDFESHEAALRADFALLARELNGLFKQMAGIFKIERPGERE